MIRFAWLQTRTQTLASTVAVFALAVLATVTGVHLAHLYTSMVTHCQSGCDLASSQFASHYNFLQHASDILAQVAPPLIGLFWGAPLLARELETGSYRLAWTQSVTRSRWLLTKLGLGALATVTLAGLLTLTITWWYRSLDKVGTNQYAVFDRRDLVPIGYALFAFATGALFGALLRRTVPAMVATLVLYVFTRVASALWIRPHLLSPKHTASSLLDANGFGFTARDGAPLTMIVRGSGPPQSWTLHSHLVTSTGQRPSASALTTFLQQNCPSIGLPPTAPAGRGIKAAPDPAAFRACQAAAARTYHLDLSYQPAGHYWPLQWLETGVFVGLALLAAAGCYWLITRRTA
jgi:ABC-type transport system involved in multi-copper enzyme maturation permease subunit